MKPLSHAEANHQYAFELLNTGNGDKIIQLAADNEKAMAMWTDLFVKTERGFTGNAHDLIDDITNSHGDDMHRKPLVEVDHLISTANDLADSIVDGNVEGKQLYRVKLRLFTNLTTH